MNENEHVHRIQSQWVTFLPLIWNSGRFQLPKEALEGFIGRKMTARGELRFFKGMARREEVFFAGEIEFHFRDRETAGEVGKE
jgi:hypothetical protein